MSQIQLRDNGGNGIPRINVRIAPGHGSTDEASADVFTDLVGNSGWPPFPGWPIRDYTLWINDHNIDPRYQATSIYVEPSNGEYDDVVVTLAYAARTLSRLRAERFGFVNGEGQRVFLAGMSGFMDYRLFLDGELGQLREMLAQAEDLGANCRRVFGMAHYIEVNQGRPPFRPQDRGDRYFDAQPDFFALEAEYSQHVYWSVFPDNDIIGVPDPRGFFVREVETLKRAESTLGELTNEQDAHGFNHVDPDSMPRPDGIAFCSGSYGDIGGPHPSPWDFCDYHQPRRYEPPTHIKDACVVDHPSYLQGHGVLLGEPDRYGTDGNSNVDQARQSAGACRETALGMFYHTAQGRDGHVLDNATMDQGRVFFKALVGAR